MRKGIIFDFDGVIIETESAKFKDLRELLAATGRSLPDRDFPLMAGKKTVHFLHERYPDMSDRDIKRILRERASRLRRHLTEYPLIQGVKQFLTFLSRRRHPIALATGSGRSLVNAVSAHHKLAPYFSVRVTGEDFSSSKPDPECFRIALARMRVAPQHTLVVEDFPAGIQAAKSLGCPVFALSTTMPRKALAGADHIFTDHRGILAYLGSRAENGKATSARRQTTRKAAFK